MASFNRMSVNIPELGRMNLRDIYTSLDTEQCTLSETQLKIALEQTLIKLGRFCEDFESPNAQRGVQVICNDRDQMRIAWLIAKRISNLRESPDIMVGHLDHQDAYPIRVYMPLHHEACWDSIEYNAFPELPIGDINKLAETNKVSLAMYGDKA